MKKGQFLNKNKSYTQPLNNEGLSSELIQQINREFLGIDF